MTNIELYIDKKLCDIQSPDKLGVRLNRVLINPAELTTKDAQYSYSITIPATSSNDAIFGYANVEEVKNKFNHNYTAQLYVDSIRIFEGRFKLSEIDSDGNYKGNLVVPAKKTIKEIFGEKKMSEIEGAWELDVSDPSNPDNPLSMVEMLNKYNTDKDIPDCIFPLPLYGLLPKVESDDKGTVSGKTIWDKYVRLGIEDFPPSINCLETIKKIFKNNKNDSSNIGGSAFEDDRLKNLYMSYQNPTTYQQEWNWGHLGRVYIEGHWTNFEEVMHGAKKVVRTEKSYSRNEDGRILYAANLLSGTGSYIDKLHDYGTNVLHSVTESDDKKTRHSHTHITIPFSGLYKISLYAKLQLDTKKNKHYGSNPQIISSNFGGAFNDFNARAHEIKLIRDYGTGVFDLEKAGLDAFYNEPNLAQNNNWESYDKATGDVSNPGDFPKYYPVPGKQCVQFIDPKVNETLISGFRWGNFVGLEDSFPRKKFIGAVVNTNLKEKDYLARILAIKHGWSRDVTFSQKEKIYSAINNIHKLPGVDPNGDLDYDGHTYSGCWLYGMPESEIVIEEESGETEEPGEPEIIDDVPYGWYPSGKYKIQIDQKCFEDTTISAENNIVCDEGFYSGEGTLHQIVWLNKGEHITLISVSDAGVARERPRKKGPERWMKQDVDFKLDIRPFKKEPTWITIDNKGTGTAEMKEDLESDFNKLKLNLLKFLPSEQKIDEWLDNFCKAFNLELTQPKDGKFELNVKQTRSTASAASVIDLDGKASIAQRTNQPLGLPSEFQLGFKINKEEEGYVKSEGNKDGGGSFITGNIDGQVVTQTSNFSYNWFKDITRVIETKVKNAEGNIVTTTSAVPLKLPVISHKEIWATDDGKDDKEMMKKLYTNYSQRFWYKNDTPDNVGIVWENTDKKIELMLPQLENTLNKQDVLNLDYYDNPNSILNTYFSIIATDDSNYTYVECYLNPDEYEQMDGTKLVKLNGDLYYVAAVEGYDPTGRNKTKLKLIRKV